MKVLAISRWQCRSSSSNSCKSSGDAGGGNCILMAVLVALASWLILLPMRESSRYVSSVTLPSRGGGDGIDRSNIHRLINSPKLKPVSSALERIISYSIGLNRACNILVRTSDLEEALGISQTKQDAVFEGVSKAGILPPLASLPSRADARQPEGLGMACS